MDSQNKQVSMPRAGLIKAVQKKKKVTQSRPNFFIQNKKLEEDKKLDSKLNTEVENSMASGK